MSTIGKIPRRIPSLDGMRGAGALVVFTAHAQIPAIYERLGPGFMFSIGELGLTMFFFMSGFIITTLLRDEYTRKGTISFRNFYLRRFYRLAAPFFLTMLAVLVVVKTGLMPSPFEWLNYLGQLLQAGNYIVAYGDDKMMRTTGSGVIWSLAVENHFYLVFPAALLFLLRRTSLVATATALLLVCGMVLLWRWIAWFELELPRGGLRYTTDMRIDSILAGCIMALWRNPFLDDVRRCGQGVGTVLAAASCAIMVTAPLCPLESISIVLLYAIQLACLWVVFMLAMLHPDWLCFRWLNNRIMIWLGTISYTFYLTHQVIMKLLREHTGLDPVGVATTGFIITVALASASFVYMEGPLGRLRKKLH